MKRKNLFLVSIISLSCISLLSCAQKKILDPNNPTQLTIWHYYNGPQQTAFNEQVTEFNLTRGKELGIYVECVSKGSVNELEKAIRDSVNEVVGAERIPDIFSSYADTAYAIQKNSLLVDLNKYFTKNELSNYVEGYIEEGRFGKDNSLYLLPVAKSTEVFAMNKTEWTTFSTATNSSLSELSTTEGITQVAKKYYEWTDSQTPNIPNDGKAFYGRDSMSNYIILGMKQMGHEILGVKDGKLILDADKDSLKRLWDNYYIPMVNGYFGEFGRFRSDDVKTGDIISYTGSSSSISYFPDFVDNGEEKHNIDYIILNAPIMNNGERVFVQQGAGMAITKSDEKHEYASSIFLKWFTEAEHNISFSIGSSYLPVRNDANNINSINKVIDDDNLKINAKTKECLNIIMNSFNNSKFYSSKNYENAYDVRNILDQDLSNLAKNDRATVLKLLEEGKTREEALSSFTTDAKFESWYSSFVNKINEAAYK